jgi:serine/threonine-protein kinase RsbW
MNATLAAHQASPVLDLDLDATFDAVSAAGERLGSLLEQHFGDERGAQLRLGIVEAMTNVVEHGCAGREGGHLHVLAVAGPSQWCFTLTDNGRPIPGDALRGADGSVFDFDPDVTAELPEGGMGLSLIQMVFDRVDYKVEATSNRLILTAFISA